MTTIKALIKKHPLLGYLALTFAITWRGMRGVAPPGSVVSSQRMARTHRRRAVGRNQHPRAMKPKVEEH